MRKLWSNDTDVWVYRVSLASWNNTRRYYGPYASFPGAKNAVRWLARNFDLQRHKIQIERAEVNWEVVDAS